MLTGASKGALFDLSHEETIGVFYAEEWGRDIPSRGPACSKAWRLESVACLENRK